MRIVFGSCRVAAPHEPPHTLRKDEHPDGREVDALRGLALRMTHAPPEEWPHALLLLGDQVYADEVHPELEGELDGGDMVVSYDDYVKLYIAAWGEPVIRWLLSTIPSAMIFDDHDVHDDWNTSIEWVTEMRQKDWWRKRIVSAFESYLIYQHLGNLSPSERADFELYEHLRTAEDPTPRLRAFAKQADEEVQGTRWSFCRDIGPARVVMIDSRAGRVLDPEHRAMVDPDEWRWIEEHARGDVDHLLIGTSLPMFMGPALHWLEAWNEVVADGGVGQGRQEGRGEAAPGARSRALARLPGVLPADVRPAGRGRRRPPRRGAVDDLPALSGDVHHAYLAEVGFLPGTGVQSSVWQAVCSPFRNPLDSNERRVILGAWTPRRGRRHPHAGQAGGGERPAGPVAARP